MTIASHTRAERTAARLPMREAVPSHPRPASDDASRMVQWFHDFNRLCWDIKLGRVHAKEWHTKAEEIAVSVAVPEIMSFIGFDQLLAHCQFLETGAKDLQYQLPQPAGQKSYIFPQRVFALKRGCSIVPHGHNQLASLFLVLCGELRGRHFDRIRDEPGYLVIKPTIDCTFRAGECSTISDFRDNLHWFQAISNTAFVLNISFSTQPRRSFFKRALGRVRRTLGYKPPPPRDPRVYVNPEGERLPGGLIRAPVISHDECERLFGYGELSTAT